MPPGEEEKTSFPRKRETRFSASPIPRFPLLRMGEFGLRSRVPRDFPQATLAGLKAQAWLAHSISKAPLDLGLNLTPMRFCGNKFHGDKFHGANISASAVANSFFPHKAALRGIMHVRQASWK
jgi:hypothetical protein